MTYTEHRAVPMLQKLLLVVGLAAHTPLIGIAYSQDLTVDRAVRETITAVARPLPSLDAIAGSSLVQSNSKPPVLVAVGGFREGGSGLVSERTIALGYYSSVQLQGTCSEYAIVPAYYIGVDVRGEINEATPTASEIRERIKRRVGPVFLVTGSVQDLGAEVALDVSLIRISTGEETVFASVRVDRGGLEAALTEQLQAFASAFCPTAKLRAESQGVLLALERILRTQHRESLKKKLIQAQEELNRFNQSAVLATATLEAIWSKGASAADLGLIRRIISEFPNSDAVQLLGNYVAILASPRYSDAMAMDKLRAQLSIKPKDFATLLALLDAYRVEQIMYFSPQGPYGTTKVISGPIDHHEGTARAITLGLELIERYPQYYRSWFHAGMAILKYGSLVRGTKFWAQLSEDQKTRDSSTKRVASRMIMKARSMHPQKPWIHHEMIGLASTVGESKMDSFRRAVALAPHDASIYQTAYNFATPQWGGTPAERREIYQTSVRNNPGETWTRNLRDIWAKDITGFWRFDNGWLWLGFAAIATVFGVVVLSRNRSG